MRRTGGAVRHRTWGTALRSSASQILETALALRQAPGERFRLLRQPLPAGITLVIEVASGAPQALKDAAADLGEAEGVVLEAARFYLEQMLFAAPEADAYRVLGVSPRAEHGQIRLHHRLLQRWLHPDRAIAGDATIFATRVNQAWAQLRTPALRDDYDASLRNHGADDGGQATAPEFRAWHYDEPMPSHGRRSRWLFVAALACSVVLAVLIVRHEDGSDQVAWDAVAAADSEHVSQPPESADSDLGDLDSALVRRSPPRDPRALRAQAPVSPAAVSATPTATATAPAPRAAAQASGPVDARPATTRQPATVPTASVAAVPSSPRPVGRLAAAQAHAPAPPPAPVPVPAKALAIASPAKSPLPAHAPPSASLVATTAIVAPRAIAATIASPPLEVPSAPVHGPADANPDVLIDRMRKAEQRVAQVAAYLSSIPGAAPLWNDVRTQADADRIRRRLSVRQGSALRLLAPNWQLQPGDASFSSPYRCDRCAMDEGHLDVQLVWREGLWLVRGVGVGPSA